MIYLQKAWLQILQDRNTTLHIYDDSAANTIFDRIRTKYFALFSHLSDKPVEKIMYHWLEPDREMAHNRLSRL